MFGRMKVSGAALLLASGVVLAIGAPEAGADGDCLVYDRVERGGVLGEGIDVNGPEYWIRQKGDSRRGWMFDIELRHTAPPDRICPGDTLEIRLVATNHNVQPDDRSMHRAGGVNMDVDAAFNADVSCSWKKNLTAAVAAYEHQTINTCRVTINTVPLRNTPVSMIWSGFGTAGFSGNVAVFYSTE